MTIHNPYEQSLDYLQFEIITLDNNESKHWELAYFEAVFVLIQGECIIESGGKKERLYRKNVFDDKPSALYATLNSEVLISSITPTVIAVCKAKANKIYKNKFILPEMTKISHRGKDNYNRQIIDIVNTNINTQHIAIGETINEPGEWSSFPPHKHDENIDVDDNIIEVKLEEIYYYRINPDNGFALQRLYNQDESEDNAIVIKDGDIVEIPKGYHPVVTIPGYRLYYLWILAGNERKYLWNTQNKYKWLE